MISSRLTGTFPQKSIFDPPTPLSPSHAVKFWSKTYQISEKMPHNRYVSGISIESDCVVLYYFVSINTLHTRGFKRCTDRLSQS